MAHFICILPYKILSKNPERLNNSNSWCGWSPGLGYRPYKAPGPYLGSLTLSQNNVSPGKMVMEVMIVWIQNILQKRRYSEVSLWEGDWIAKNQYLETKRRQISQTVKNKSYYDNWLENGGKFSGEIAIARKAERQTVKKNQKIEMTLKV